METENATRLKGYLGEFIKFSDLKDGTGILCNFTIITESKNKTGKTYRSFIPVTAFGDHATTLRGLKKGDWVKVSGKLTSFRIEKGTESFNQVKLTASEFDLLRRV